MADLRALIRESTGGVRNLVPGGADVLEVSDYDFAGAMNFGPNATGIDIGQVGITTTIKGDFQVDGATTLVSTSTLEGDVDIGDGGNTITIGGDGVAGAGDVIYLGTESTGIGTDSDVTLRTLMLVDGSASNGRITGDDATFDFSDPGCGVIIPNVASGSAVASDGSIIIDGSDLKWYDGAAWFTAAFLGGVTLDYAYDGGGAGLGRTITADSGAVEITVPNTSANAGLIVNQNDVTNNPNGIEIANAGTGVSLSLQGATRLINSDNAGMTISTTTAGDLTISSAAGIDVDAAGVIAIDSLSTIDIGVNTAAGDISIGTNATARIITVGNATGVTAVNIGSGTGGVHISDVVASLDLNGGGALTETALVSADITPSGTLTLRGGGISQFGDDVGYFNFDGLGALTTGGITTVDLDCSGALQINSTGGAISIGNDADVQNVNLGTGAAARTITVGNAASTEVEINAIRVDINAGTNGVQVNAVGAGITMGSDIASNFTVTGVAQNLTLAVAGGGAQKLIFDSAGTGVDAIDIKSSVGGVQIDAATTIEINSAGGFISIGNDAVAQNLRLGTGGARTIAIGNVLATGVYIDAIIVSLDASAASNFTVDGADLTLQTTTSNDVIVDAFRDVLIKNNTNTVATFDASGITLAAGASIGEFSIDGTLAGNSDVAVPTEKAVKTYVDGAISGADVWLATADEAILVGDAICGALGTDDRVNQANADSTGAGRQYCLGFATSAAAGAGNTCNIQSFGLMAQVNCPNAEAWVRGHAIYLDDVASQVSNVAPVGVGDVVQRVGWAAETNAVGTARTMFIAIGDPTIV